MMKKVPKRRFKGFLNAGDWEQRKLGELVTVFSGQDYKHLSEGDIPVYGTGGYMLSVNEALSNDQDAIGIGRKGTIDKPYILKAPFWTVDTLFYAIPKEKMDLNFIFCIFKNVDWRKLDESTGVPSLSKSTITNVDVYCPFFEEQLLIGRFFSWIDSSITLHQRKLEKLQATKKALLYELFPIENSRRPKRRFKGFTGDWEQRKLGEIASINPRTELPNSFKYVDLESVIGTNLIGCKKIEKENAPSRAQRLASFGDIFYQTVRPYQRNNYLFEKDDDDVVFSTGYAQLRSELDSYFLFTLVQTDSFVSKVLDHCTGTSYPAINSSELGKILISVPQNKLESHQIGTVFRVLDTLITLHQRKLEKLKNLKAAYLNEMFV